MPIVTSDINIRLSGGAANADPNASLGGAMSSTAVIDATLHNLFDVVSGQETADGDTEYRCFYFRNAHATLPLLNPVVWIQTNTPSPDTDCQIGVDAAGVNGTAAIIADESTAPAGVSFAAHANKAAGISVADIPAGQHIAIWVKRTVSAGGSAYNNDSVVIKIEGETGA